MAKFSYVSRARGSDIIGNALMQAISGIGASIGAGVERGQREAKLGEALTTVNQFGIDSPQAARVLKDIPRDQQAHLRWAFQQNQPDYGVIRDPQGGLSQYDKKDPSKMTEIAAPPIKPNTQDYWTAGDGSDWVRTLDPSGNEVSREMLTGPTPKDTRTAAQKNQPLIVAEGIRRLREDTLDDMREIELMSAKYPTFARDEGETGKEENHIYLDPESGKEINFATRNARVKFIDAQKRSLQRRVHARNKEMKRRFDKNPSIGKWTGTKAMRAEQFLKDNPNIPHDHKDYKAAIRDLEAAGLR